MSNEPEHPQDQPQERKNNPTPVDLLRIWKEGGKERLAEMLHEVDDGEELVFDKNLLATMTEEEQRQLFSELLDSRKTFRWNGLKCFYDWSLGPISMSFGGPLAGR